MKKITLPIILFILTVLSPVSYANNDADPCTLLGGDWIGTVNGNSDIYVTFYHSELFGEKTGMIAHSPLLHDEYYSGTCKNGNIYFPSIWLPKVLHGKIEGTTVKLDSDDYKFVLYKSWIF